MTVVLYPRGCLVQQNKWHYMAIAYNGAVLDLFEHKCLPKETKIELPDDMCQPDSGWVQWQCGACGAAFWTRTRPGGRVVCSCGHQEVCPEGTRLYDCEGGGDFIDAE